MFFIEIHFDLQACTSHYSHRETSLTTTHHKYQSSLDSFDFFAGGPVRSDDLHLSSHDQVHVPQVWSLRRGGEARRSLYFTAQHCQWEDQHLHLVLVRIFSTRAPPPPKPKVRRVNRSRAKFCFVKWFNWLLIDFFNPNLSAESKSLWRNWFQQLKN